MKISCFSVKPIKVFLSLFLICLSLCFMTSTTQSQTVFFGYTERKVPIYSVQTNEKKVALTFDAAWGADKTSKIVEILKENDILGTFFLVGFWSEKYQDKIKEIDNAGFDIGSHSNTHPKMSTLTTSKIQEELTVSCKLISDITGKPVRFFRPPFGDYNDNLLDVADNLGLQTIQWNIDSLDWKGLNTNQMLERIKKGLTNGSIILFHNNSDHIIEALPTIINYIKQEGYKMVKLSDLVFEKNYIVNNNGIQILK